MAEKDKKKRVLKSAETVRERSEKPSVEKPRRIRRTAGAATVPFKAAHRFGQKEYYLPMPDNRLGRFLNKRRHFLPRYFRESWQELKQVVWPSRRETWKLTLAVFMFSIVFGLLIAVTDYGLDKVFKRILIR